MGGHGPGWHGSWGGGWGDGPGRRGGPPPWLGELLGMGGQRPPQRPRAKKGDVRAAILDVLAVEPLNGYQVIQQIAERSGGQWKPSPGSVYPTVAQLEDEGLVTADDHRGRTLRLTPEGETYVAEHPEELAAVWADFDGDRPGGDGPDLSQLKTEVGQLMSATWQIVTQGSDRQRREAMTVLVDTRRKLYGLLADDRADDRADDGADEDAAPEVEAER
jgi:DNA-binding PadR family transcriptional regulator